MKFLNGFLKFFSAISKGFFMFLGILLTIALTVVGALFKDTNTLLSMMGQNSVDVPPEILAQLESAEPIFNALFIVGVVILSIFVICSIGAGITKLILKKRNKKENKDKE